MGVVTQPDRAAGRGHKLVATPVKRTAEALGLRVLTPEKLKPFVDDARALGAEAFVVASYGKIVPQALLDAVPIAFNEHPSLLPLYRGATPLQSAIRDGRSETGVTIIAMDAGMDTGDVLLQERTPIGATETYGELHDRLAKRGAEMAVEAVDRYANGRLTRKPQSEVARDLGISDDEIARSLTRPLRREDLVIDWRRPPDDIVRLVRSLAPAPFARTDYAGEAIKVVAAHAISLEQLQAQLGGHKPWVSVGLSVSGVRGRELLYAVHPDGAVVVDRLIAPSRGPLSGGAYARGVLAKAQARLDEATR
ncbi:MAG: methionyl-tRNA formyltransferase [Candidatus Eremiobacteraeota bacterium]|nr:methionyl-tRNA formyltransferase [Candidatus Eremiobacteraeota bacterium]